MLKLAPTACITAIVLLAQDANILPSLLWPWALAVPPSFALALWMSTPRRSAWVEPLIANLPKALRSRRR